jgi:O-methyltransferase
LKLNLQLNHPRLIDNLLKDKLISDQVSRAEIKEILSLISKVVTSGLDGAICEFGCYAGTTSLFISKFLKEIKASNEFWVYDSFQGLPQKTLEDMSSVGLEFKSGELKFSKKDFINHYKKAMLKPPTIKKGWFSNLEDSDLPSKVALAFLDGDYYSSVLDPLNLIDAKLEDGAIIIVDDYLNPKLPGASKALDEWINRNKINHKLRIVSDMAVVELV